MMALLVFSTAAKLPCSVFGVGLYMQQRLALANMVSLCGEFLRVILLAVLLLRRSHQRPVGGDRERGDRVVRDRGRRCFCPCV